MVRVKNESNSADFLHCSYCAELIDDDSYLHCEQCEGYVHVKCLRHASTPGDLLGDVFFDFTCAKCMQLQYDGPSTSSGASAKEKFVRQRLPWLLVIILALYNLSIKSKGLSHHGYFHWRTHIVAFIDKNWDFLFEPNTKKRKKWIGSVTGNMSHNSPEFFLSGHDVFQESGWWKLTHANQTPRYIYNLYEELCQRRQLARSLKRSLEDHSQASELDSGNNSAQEAKRIRSQSESDEETFEVESCSRTLPYMGRKPKQAKSLNNVTVVPDSSKLPAVLPTPPSSTTETEPLSSVQTSLMDFLAESLASDDLTLFNNLPNIAPEPLIHPPSIGKNDFLLDSLEEAQHESASLFDLADIKAEPSDKPSYEMPPEVSSKLRTLYKQDEEVAQEEYSTLKVKQEPRGKKEDFIHVDSLPNDDVGGGAAEESIECDIVPKVEDEDNSDEEEFKPRIVQVTNFQQLEEKELPPNNLPADIEIKNEAESEKADTDDGDDATVDEHKDDVKRKVSKSNELPPCKPSLFTKSIRRPLPWTVPSEIEDPNFIDPLSEATADLRMMSEYEERQMLQKMRQIFALEAECKLEISPYIRRFYRKLCVRDWKREHSIPQFNLDSYFNGEGGKAKNERKPQIIDRYQLISLTPQDSRRSFYARIAGSCDYELFESPYTGRILHPFIYRNKECMPPWLKLMCEVQYAVNGVPPKRAPIDFCYVRPNHIAAVNALLQSVFWPGIDMSDCLSYPDFSVVALYKKLVVGCGFLVPDVGYNEAYISFMAVRPAWQRSGIATFMLYHLIQTCMSKDITLHVSADNPAVVLYQKFGFKIEQVMLDFYEKYLPLDSKQSRHAFFLRLMR